MQLRDVLSPFVFADNSVNDDLAETLPQIRIAVVTEQRELQLKLERTFQSSRYTIQQMGSFGSFDVAGLSETCDVVIADIESKELWPAAIFVQFDEVAMSFPVLVLCRELHEVSKYLLQAKHVTDVFPYDSVDDLRFPSLIEAAVFRAEVAGSSGVVGE